MSTLRIVSPYNLKLRLDKLLRDRLGLSRIRLENCLRRGDITCTDADFNPEKPRLMLKGDMTLHIRRAVAEVLNSVSSL